MECDEVMSLTVSTEGTLMTAVIKAQGRSKCHNIQHPKCICPNPSGREGQRWKSDHHEDKGNLCGHPL